MDVHELANTLQVSQHYVGSYSTTQTPSDGVDTQGVINPSFFVAVGAMAAASPNAAFIFSLQESDEVSANFTNVAGANMVTDPNCNQPDDIVNGIFVTVDVDNDTLVHRVTYKGTKRYLRVIATIDDEPSATPIAVLFAGIPSISPPPV